MLVGQPAGVLADRWDRRRVLLGADVVLAVLTLGYLAIDPGLWGRLAGLTFLRSCVGQFVGPAEHALLPELAPPDRLGEIAALNTLNSTLGRLVGPALGGLLLATTGLGGAVVLVALCHARAAAAFVAAVGHRRSPDAEHPAPGLLRPWREGATLAWREPVLRALVPLVVLITFGEGLVSALPAPFTHEQLDAGADVLGWILSAQAVGGIIGLVVGQPGGRPSRAQRMPRDRRRVTAGTPGESSRRWPSRERCAHSCTPWTSAAWIGSSTTHG